MIPLYYIWNLKDQLPCAGLHPTILQSLQLPSLEIKEELRVRDRDIINLLNRETYMSEAKKQERHTALYG